MSLRTVPRLAALITAGLLCTARLDTSLADPRGDSALDPALRAIDVCIARLDAEVDVGYRRIAALCPELRPALEAGGLERWLPPDWRDPDNDLSAAGLAELRQLLARDLTMGPIGPAPSVRRLQQVLAELAAPAPARGGIRGKLESWLRRIGGPRAPSSGSGGLGRLLHRMAPTTGVARLIAYAALAGLVALAGLILFNELRMAGLLRARFSRPGTRGAERTVDPVAATGGLETADLADRARTLLGAILERVSRTRGVTGLRSLTAREVIRAVIFDDPDANRQITQLALTTERMRYAPRPASRAEIVAAVEGASALLERLNRAGRV